ncbi:MAG TPA: hypothetical protein V6C97_36335 [Oculatellaceae cyanobacterium]
MAEVKDAISKPDPHFDNAAACRDQLLQDSGAYRRLSSLSNREVQAAYQAERDGKNDESDRLYIQGINEAYSAYQDVERGFYVDPQSCRNLRQAIFDVSHSNTAYAERLQATNRSAQSEPYEETAKKFDTALTSMSPYPRTVIENLELPFKLGIGAISKFFETPEEKTEIGASQA